MHRMLCLVAALSLLVGVTPRSSHAEVTAEQVRVSIERGVDYLKREQDRQRGTWPDYVMAPGGVTALCTMALLNCGVPADDPAVSLALEYLRKNKFDKTYSVALQTLVLCEAKQKQDLLLIQQNVNWLESKQIRSNDEYRGSWAYPEGKGDGSNTQFAMLALHEADRAGAKVSQQTWRLALAYWENSQNPDGSWSYVPGHPDHTGSMTCAGIACVLMARERLNPGDVRVEGDQVVCCAGHEEDKTVERALAWLGRRFSISANPGYNGGQRFWLYYLYGLERAGRLTNQRFIGQHDWYREGAEILTREQVELTGFWRMGLAPEDQPAIATSLSLLFLSKGRRPVLAAKLKHGDDNDWNHHRSDLDRLTIYCEQKWDRPLTWQVIDARAADADDLSEAPVLFISGEQDPQFTDAQARTLREYIDRGGFIFAEAACGGKAFDAGFRDLVERMFPESEHKLRLLPPEHLVWNAEELVDPAYARPLYGVDVGCRTSIIYCPENLGCYWELSRVGSSDADYPESVKRHIAAVRAIGVNVMAYATNREPRYKLDNPRLALGKDDQDEFERAKIYIAKVRHGGGWDAAPGALSNLLRTVSSKAGLRLSTEKRELALEGKNIFDYHLVFMHGRNDFRLSDAERKTLREYVERGGMIMADAVCASEEFAAAFRREMAAVFPDRQLEAVPPDHPILTTQFGGFDLRSVSRRDPRRRDEKSPLKASLIDGPPELEAIRIDDRLAVVFSKYDLSCALELHDSLECPGYTQEDAARIGLNIVLYSLF